MILHLTDTHFGTERPEVMRALIDLAALKKPSLIVLSGDITQRARRSQFAAARAFVQRLCEVAGADAARDVLTIPGNHDVPLLNPLARLLAPYGEYQRAFGSDLEPACQRPGLWVIGVNTTRFYRHADGEVSHAQADRVAARLLAAPAGALRVVVTHQPLHVIEAGDVKDLAHGHAQALALWSAAGADLLLAGHIHQAFTAPVRAAVPLLAHDTWVVQTGTAVSSRTRERVPNSVHLIDVKSPADTLRAVVERWDYADAGLAAGQFQRVRLTPIPRPAG